MGGCTSASAKGKEGKRRLLDDYIMRKKLGEGAFGVVFAATQRTTSLEVAVKMVDKAESPMELILAEADMMKQLGHPNIIRFLDLFEERCFVCIVMDKYTGGSLVDGLHHHMEESGRIPCHDIKHIFEQMGSSLQHLHSRLIVHRDIKGDNYLMSHPSITYPKCIVVLTDFGTAIFIKADERCGEEVGTRIFWSPERFDHSYGFSSDIWSMGVTAYGLVDGRFPFGDDEEIKSKDPKLPKKLDPVCGEYVTKMLEKKEGSRATADEVMAHSWLADVKGGRDDEKTMEGEDSLSDDDEPNAKVFGDTANEDVADRRQELVDRLNNQHMHNNRPGTNLLDDTVYMKDQKDPAVTNRFDWWDRTKAIESGILKVAGQRQQTGFDLERDPDVVKRQLEAHDIATSAFGTGNAKPLKQLAGEVFDGSSRLMLDATEHKKLVRVVDVVVMRLSSAQNSGKVLIETGEKFPDGRTREVARLPGAKKHPHENSMETVKRCLETFMNAGDVSISFNFDEKEFFEDEVDSPSFPGVRTVYRKEIVQCYVSDQRKEVLGRIGLPKCDVWESVEKNNNTKYYQWATEKQALEKKVKLRALGSEEVSGLVLAPIGMHEPALKAYLEKHKIDTKRFGQNGAKSLKEFAAALTKGESSLLVNPEGKVIRTIDLVSLQIMKKEPKKTTAINMDVPEGQLPEGVRMLVHTEVARPGDEKKTVNRLPCATRRPDENHFITVRRILEKQLQTDENQVKLHPELVRCYEEFQPSSVEIPGLPTMLRTYVVPTDILLEQA